MMDSIFYENMAEIAKKPSLHDMNSVEEIHNFILGIDSAFFMYNIEKKDEGLRDFRANFYEWVRDHFKIKSTQGWVQIIRFFSRDSQHSVETFFRLLEKFKNREQS